MRLLGVLGLGAVPSRLFREVGLAEVAGDQPARRGNGLLGDLHAVGAHVGDEPHGLAAQVDAFIELLGQAHGAGGAEAQLARGLLLQGGGGERRLRVAARPLGLDVRHGEGPGRAELLAGPLRRRGVAQVEALELAAVQLGQAGGEGLSPRGFEAGLDGPVLLRPEGLDLGLPLADQAQGDRLDPAGRAAARQLAPEHGRQGEAHQVVERAAREVGVDQLLVQDPGMAEGLLDGALGHLVEDDAADLHAAQGLAAVQLLGDVPGDGLALAVRVGRQIEPRGALEGLGDLLQPLVRPRVDRPDHGEAVVRQHRAVLGRQVAHVAIAGQDPEVVAQVLVDGFRLGRRFDDNDVHATGNTPPDLAGDRPTGPSSVIPARGTRAGARRQDNWHSRGAPSTSAPSDSLFRMIRDRLTCFRIAHDRLTCRRFDSGGANVLSGRVPPAGIQMRVPVPSRIGCALP